MPTTGLALRRAVVTAAVLAVIGSQAVTAVEWNAVATISNSGTASAPLQSTAVTGTQTVHVAYTDQVGEGAFALYRRSTDGGANWEPPVDLSRDEAFGSTSLAIESDGTTVDLVIGELDALGHFALWYRRSMDEGANWSPPLRLTSVNGQAGKADVSRSGSRVTVAWTDSVSGTVYVRTSTDGGGDFGPRVRIGETSNQPYANDSYDAWAAVADDAGTINVAWKRNDRTLRVKRSTSGGAGWSSSRTLADRTDGLYISLVAAGKKVFVGYTDAVEGHWRATMRRSMDEGATWKSSVRVGGQDSWFPIFEVRGRLLRTAFSRCVEDVERECVHEVAYLRTSQDFGRGWSATSKVSRSGDTPFAFATGLGALADDRTIVVFGRIDADEEQALFARSTQ